MKPGSTGGANENYPRELMQLFTIGLWQLNPDGSQMLDAGGSPIPTYDQADRAAGGAGADRLDLRDRAGRDAASATTGNTSARPMETRPANHDTTAKSFLGCTCRPARRSQQDLDGVLDCLMQPSEHGAVHRHAPDPQPGDEQSEPGLHPARRRRVRNNGGGVRGDLKAVVRAILTDAEARQDTATVDAGPAEGADPAVVGSAARAERPVPQHAAARPICSTTWRRRCWRRRRCSAGSRRSTACRGARCSAPSSRSTARPKRRCAATSSTRCCQQPGRRRRRRSVAVPAVRQRHAGPGRSGESGAALRPHAGGMKQALITAATPGYDAKTRIETVLYLTALSGQYAVQY